MNRTMIVAGVVALVVGLAAVTTLFTVHQRQQAIVLRFGEVVRVIGEPGLNWKIPFAEEVVFFRCPHSRVGGKLRVVGTRRNLNSI